jgi:hypothetical protein
MTFVETLLLPQRLAVTIVDALPPAVSALERIEGGRGAYER